MSYYEQHKEELKKKANERVTCDCGKKVCRSALSHHQKTKVHQKKMQMQTRSILCNRADELVEELNAVCRKCQKLVKRLEKLKK